MRAGVREEVRKTTAARATVAEHRCSEEPPPLSLPYSQVGQGREGKRLQCMHLKTGVVGRGVGWGALVHTGRPSFSFFSSCQFMKYAGQYPHLFLPHSTHFGRRNKERILPLPCAATTPFFLSLAFCAQFFGGGERGGPSRNGLCCLRLHPMHLPLLPLIRATTLDLPSYTNGSISHSSLPRLLQERRSSRFPLRYHPPRLRRRKGGGY